MQGRHVQRKRWKWCLYSILLMNLFTSSIPILLANDEEEKRGDIDFVIDAHSQEKSCADQYHDKI